MCCRSKEAARLLYIMCKRDILFFINTFCFIYEPRPTPENPTHEIPFNTWGFQDETLLDMRDAIGKTDVGVEKSRDQGMTWMVLVLFLWFWLFHPLQSFMLVSRNGDLVDMTGNTDTLFSKLDFMINWLPGFLRPAKTRNYMVLKNEENGSVINGARTTGDAGRGGRRTAVFGDELPAFELPDSYEFMKATQYNTRTRILVGTPKGKAGAYYDAMKKPDSPMKKIRLHWSRHPLQRRGAYQYMNSTLHLFDPAYQYPKDYNFIRDGKLRSPYYDTEESRALSPSDVAAELDIDYGGSDNTYFDPATLDRYTLDSCRPPAEMMPLREFLLGAKVDISPMAWERINSANPVVHLWVRKDTHGNFPRNRNYFTGADIAGGTGASNSCLSVLDGKTGEKVLEFACARIMPNEFAQVAVAICEMFEGSNGRPARLIWEQNGPGRQFGQTVIELGFREVYYRTNETSLAKKQTDTPGWVPTPENQLALVAEYRRALASGQLVDRSKASIDEARDYIHTKDGSVRHVNSTRNLDPSGAKKNHGDRVMATGLAWWICRGAEAYEVAEDKVKQYAPGTVGHRLAEYQAEQENSEKRGREYMFAKPRQYTYSKPRRYGFQGVA